MTIEDNSQITLEDFFHPLGPSKVCTGKNLALRTKLYRILSSIKGDPLAEMMGGNTIGFWSVHGIGPKGLDFIEDRLEELNIAPWQLHNKQKERQKC
jgi:hypothetical protein